MTSFNESEIYNFWTNENIFEKSLEESKDDELFIFYDGPPFATGLPHYGHILAGNIKDTIGRFQTQNGKHVPRKNGFDTHGLPIEYEIEKIYDIKTTKQIEEIGIKTYNSYCKSIVLKYADEWKRIMGRLGRWIDFDDGYKTMDFSYMKSVWWVISELNNKKLLYSSYKVMPYSVACKTPLSNFETQQNYQEVNDTSLYVKFKLNQDISESQTLIGLHNVIELDNIYFIIWTTTPWTLPSNLVIAINKNIKYSIIYYNNEYLILASNLIEKLFNMLKSKTKYEFVREIDGEQLLNIKYSPPFNSYPLHTIKDINNIFCCIHGDFVSESDGTGIVHIAPSYGSDDYEVCIANNIIDKKDILFMSTDDEGFFVNNLNELEDLGGVFYKNHTKSNTEDGNTKIIKKLKDNKTLFYQYSYRHNYPFCWRSDTPLMYRAVKSWFVSVETIRD
jgi:isoleucyl-tRNA synthetase